MAKKIMFSDKYGLTQAVLEGRKTQTRRIMNPQPEDCSAAHRWYKSAYWKDKPMSLVVNEDGSVYCELCGYGAKLEGGSIFRLPYKVGEIVAVAQSYRDCGGVNEEGVPMWEIISSKVGGTNAGWSNKMFVRSELMPHYVIITAVSVERLRDISDVDCMAEGIEQLPYGGNLKPYAFYDNSIRIKSDSEGVFYGWYRSFDTPREAYAALIDKVSGKGTWERNPYVFVYDFELVKKWK